MKPPNYGLRTKEKKKEEWKMTKLKRKEETVMKIEEIAESIDGELEDARL